MDDRHVGASTAATLGSQSAAVRAATRRDGSGPVTADEIFFTAVRHHAIRSMSWPRSPLPHPCRYWPPQPTARPAARCTR